MLQTNNYAARLQSIHTLSYRRFCVEIFYSMTILQYKRFDIKAEHLGTAHFEIVRLFILRSYDVIVNRLYFVEAVLPPGNGGKFLSKITIIYSGVFGRLSMTLDENPTVIGVNKFPRGWWQSHWCRTFNRFLMKFFYRNFSNNSEKTLGWLIFWINKCLWKGGCEQPTEVHARAHRRNHHGETGYPLFLYLIWPIFCVRSELTRAVIDVFTWHHSRFLDPNYTWLLEYFRWSSLPIGYDSALPSASPRPPKSVSELRVHASQHCSRKALLWYKYGVTHRVLITAIYFWIQNPLSVQGCETPNSRKSSWHSYTHGMVNLVYSANICEEIQSRKIGCSHKTKRTSLLLTYSLTPL